MQLILAIDSDRRQAEQLAALVRGRLAVELLQTTSAGEALQRLDDRVPDLIMTSPLLSPFDDGVLAEYLRELGPAAAHVQTLRIPVFTKAAKKSGRGLFSLRRKRQPVSHDGGCDPNVFADEIAIYLTRAADERAAAAAAPAQPPKAQTEPLVDVPVVTDTVGDEFYASYTSDGVTPAPEYSASGVIAPEPVYAHEAVEPVAPRYSDTVAPEPVLYQAHAAETEPLVYASASVDAGEPLAYASLAVESVTESVISPESAPVTPALAEIEEAVPLYLEPVTAGAEAAAAPESPVAPPAPVEIESAVPLYLEPVAVQPETVAVMEIEAETLEPVVEPSPIAAVAARPEPSAETAHDAPRTSSFEAALAAIRAAWGHRQEAPAPVAVQAAQVAIPNEIVLDESAVEVDLTADVEVIHLSADEIGELSASPALHDLDADLAAAPSPPRVPTPIDVLAPPRVEPATEPKPAARTRVEKPKKRSARNTTKRAPACPVQDEWGVFDPSQCGFSALIDKLDEVTETGDARPAGPVSVRVISFS